MTPYEIPLSPEPQRFSIDLGGELYQLRVMWNKDAQAWMLDIQSDGGIDLLLGAPLVPGLDILRQYPQLLIPGALIVQTDHDAEAVPTFDNLGVTGRLYFVTEP
jgi:hypothetical protein